MFIFARKEEILFFFQNWNKDSYVRKNYSNNTINNKNIK